MPKAEGGDKGAITGAAIGTAVGAVAGSGRDAAGRTDCRRRRCGRRRLCRVAGRRGREDGRRPTGARTAARRCDGRRQYRLGRGPGTAISLLRNRGAQMIERADGSWHNGKWVDFDPVRPPDIIESNVANDPAWERSAAMKRPLRSDGRSLTRPPTLAPHAGGTLGLYPGVARRRASADPDSHLPAARLHLAATFCAAALSGRGGPGQRSRGGITRGPRTASSSPSRS